MNEIKINTPGIKAQIYPWQATPKKIELYNPDQLNICKRKVWPGARV